MKNTEIEVTEELIRLAKKHGRKKETEGFIAYLEELNKKLSTG